MKLADKTEITKEKILNAACEQFGLHGYDGASINKICKQYGISKGLIYHNFKNKDDLYVCCAERAVNMFISYMSEQNIGADFDKYMKERCHFFETNPNYRRLIFSIAFNDDIEIYEHLKAIKDKFDDYNKDFYINAIDCLTLRDGVTKEDAIEYQKVVHNLLDNYVSNAVRSDNISLDSAIKSRENALGKIMSYLLYGIAQKKQ